MMEPNRRLERILHRVVVGAFFLSLAASLVARPRSVAPSPPASPSPAPTKKSVRQEDSVFITPAKDLLLHPDGEHKADALAHFVEGMSFEENGEMDKALAAYRKVLDVDPGQANLASRVAALLTRQDDFPEAIDVLKDAIKANPNAPGPLLQLAFIYTKYLRRTDQAIDYVNRRSRSIRTISTPTNICAKLRLELEMKRRRSNLWIAQPRSRVKTPRSGHASGNFMPRLFLDPIVLQSLRKSRG